MSTATRTSHPTSDSDSTVSASAGSDTAISTAADSRLFAVSDRTARALIGSESAAFVHRTDLALARFDALRSALPDRVNLAYAVKSNPGGPLLQALAGAGAWFDCASAGEIEAVTAARGAHQQPMDATVVFAGPGKRTTDLRAALAAGLRIQVDGVDDMARIDALLGAEFTDAGFDAANPLPVSVRVHPLADIAEANPIIGGAGPSVFGVDEEDLAEFLQVAARYPRIRIDGLQVFAAGNELDADTLLANHRVAFEIGRRLQDALGHDLTLIDIGGGLGIPYAAEEPELDLAALGAGLAALLTEHDWFRGQALLEPGRWLSGPSSVYVTTVTRVKHSRGTRFAILAGGINHLLRPLLTGQSFPVRRAETGEHDDGIAADARTHTFTLAGPLCTSLDRVGIAELPADLAAGDVLVFGQAGAYSVTQAMTNFLSHPAPEHHWVTGH